VALVTVVVVLIIGAIAWDYYDSNRTIADYPPRGEFVPVGTAEMHVICQGSGSPTLVMQPGIAGGALDWLPVMEELAVSNRVCAFDRLGQDWSDPALQPRTFATTADEWHQALQALRIEQPVVVGHSLGGAVVQIYASKYDVAGIILIEGLSADAAEAVVKRLGTYESLNLLGRVGLLRPLGTLFSDAGYPGELRSEMIALRSRSSTILNISAEGSLAASTAVDELKAAEAQMSAPLLIIAAESNELPESEQFLQALRNLDARYVDSTFVSIPDAKHYVIATHPALVANTITDWIDKRNIE
jgi:pimeloyl-ACP methyl ester carboxylesterase